MKGSKKLRHQLNSKPAKKLRLRKTRKKVKIMAKYSSKGNKK